MTTTASAGRLSPPPRTLPAEPVPQQTPIYAALVRQWSEANRAVPGRTDREWTDLVDYTSWRRG
ncbi:hypothetical protein [Streptomyces sparsus]